MLSLRNIRKTYVSGNEEVEALKGIDLEFRKSEFVSILGQSGCGKTTLLNIIGGLDRYTSRRFNNKSVSLQKILKIEIGIAIGTIVWALFSKVII